MSTESSSKLRLEKPVVLSALDKLLVDSFKVRVSFGLTLNCTQGRPQISEETAA